MTRHHVWLGRFQPFHVGHLQILRQAIAQTDAPQVVGIVCYEGSAFLEDRSGKDDPTLNVFSPYERFEMAALSLGAQGADGEVTIVFVPFLPPERWELVRAFLPPEPVFCSTTKDQVDRERFERFGEMGRDRLLLHVGSDVITSSQIRSALLARGSWEEFIAPEARGYFADIRGPQRMLEVAMLAEDRARGD